MFHLHQYGWDRIITFLTHSLCEYFIVQTQFGTRSCKRLCVGYIRQTNNMHLWVAPDIINVQTDESVGDVFLCAVFHCECRKKFWTAAFIAVSRLLSATQWLRLIALLSPSPRSYCQQWQTHLYLFLLAPLFLVVHFFWLCTFDVTFSAVSQLGCGALHWEV